MDPANLGVVLDSSIVIEAERQHLDAARFLRHIAGQLGEREAALCAISVAELAHGIHRADTAARRQARRAFLDDLKATVPVYPITGETAELVGKSTPNHLKGESPFLSMTCSSVPVLSNVVTPSPHAMNATSEKSPDSI